MSNPIKLLQRFNKSKGMDIDKIGNLIKSRFDITKVYEKYKSCLKGAQEGKVCTRFPPEPSGFLHIGHVKALFLNYHYSKIFKGKMILRFDDTNPAKEKQEYTDNIRADIKTLGVEPDRETHTSDYFDLIADKCKWMIENDLAYCDNTDVETMRKERFDGIASKCRNQTKEENLKIWNDMLKGEAYARAYCVRAKMSVDNPNKCMRDPTIYRFKDEPHDRTGNKWKVYPTYDFACPIVDSIEEVTHAMRTNEYADRVPQYEWFQKKLNLPHKTKIYEFSRLCFVSTIISKRNLTWFVNNGIVDGWNDPRFPTVQGIMRRGIILPTLIEFMLDQGPSKNNNLMEWDKIWAINKNYLEMIAGKYTAISTEKYCVVDITNIGPELEVESVPVHPKNEELGKRPLFKKNRVYIEIDDANNIKEGEKVTLMKWGNFNMKKKTVNGDSVSFEAEFLPDDKDWKSTQKITWLPADESILAKVNIIEYDHLIDVPKIEENEKLEDHVTKCSKFITVCFADPAVKELTVNDFLQFERRGNYRVDKKTINPDGTVTMDLIFIPDGKSKEMSNIKTKVDVTKFTKGERDDDKKVEEKAPAEGAPADGEEKKKKGEKKPIDEAVKAAKMKEKAEKLAQAKEGKADAPAKEEPKQTGDDVNKDQKA